MTIERLFNGGHDRTLGADLGKDLKDRARTASVKPFHLAAETDVSGERRGDGADAFHKRGHATTRRFP